MDKELKKLVGARIESLRKKHGMTLQALADAFGMTAPGVLNITRGRYVTLQRARQAADVFGVSLDELTKAVGHET